MPEQNDEAKQKVEEYRAKMKGDYEKVFGTSEGVRVLEDLKKSTFFHTSSFNVDAGQMAFNEGARTVCLHIIQMATPQPEVSKKPETAIK